LTTGAASAQTSPAMGAGFGGLGAAGVAAAVLSVAIFAGVASSNDDTNSTTTGTN
jgi:hypothetical protein